MPDTRYFLPMPLLELLGYAASVLVAVSLMMSSLVRLRVINLVGSTCFCVYGLLIHAYPVAAVNGFIAVINVYYLRRMLRASEYFTVLEVAPGSEYLRYFLDFHAREIARFVPDFTFDPAERPLTFFVLRDLVPAGLFIGVQRPDGSLLVRLDFVIPAYRDFKIGRCLFVERVDFFRARGIREIVTPPGVPAHRAYLRRMGFAPIDPHDPASFHRFLLRDAPGGSSAPTPPPGATDRPPRTIAG